MAVKKSLFLQSWFEIQTKMAFFVSFSKSAYFGIATLKSKLFCAKKFVFQTLFLFLVSFSNHFFLKNGFVMYNKKFGFQTFFACFSLDY